MGVLDPLLDEVDGEKAIRKIAAELHRRGITPEDMGRVRRISMWQGLTKNADGAAELHDLYGFQLSPSWDEGPRWQPVDRGPTVKVSAPKLGKQPSNSKSTVVLPDMQCGYYRGDDGLEPTHDPKAIDAALSVIAAARPSTVVMLGDNLDAPDFSRYRLSPAFAATTQATIDYLSTLMGRIRAAAPQATIVWLAGNHEERLQNWMMDNARAAFGLRQANPTPTDWPVLSIPHLCRLDDHEVQYVPGYPASEHWVTPTLRCIHGDRTRSRGSTAYAYLPDLRTSIIFGHVHRIEAAYATRADRDGAVTVGAFSPGCLARIDGAVPSRGQGLDLDGRPLTRSEDWQQGIAVVTVDGDDWDYEQVRIRGGVAVWRGQRFHA